MYALIYFKERTHRTNGLSLSPVRRPAELPAAAGHAVVRRLPGLEETTLGGQTGHLLHHRTPVSRLLAGTEGGGGGVAVCSDLVTRVYSPETRRISAH